MQNQSNNLSKDEWLTMYNVPAFIWLITMPAKPTYNPVWSTYVSQIDKKLVHVYMYHMYYITHLTTAMEIVV